MKTNKTLLILGLFLLLYNSCKKENKTPVLPPETQEGKQTFGCLIDNKVFVNEGTYDFGSGNIQLFHNTIGINLRAYMVNSKQNIRQEILIVVKKTIKEGLYFFNASECNGYMIDEYTGCNYETDTNKVVGTLEISKYDTVKKNLSGRFNFKAHKFYHTNANGDTLKGTCDSIITITQGRFDILYY